MKGRLVTPKTGSDMCWDALGKEEPVMMIMGPDMSSGPRWDVLGKEELAKVKTGPDTLFGPLIISSLFFYFF